MIRHTDSALALVFVLVLLVQPVAGAAGPLLADGPDAGAGPTTQTGSTATVTVNDTTLTGPVEAGETFTVNVSIATSDPVYGAQATLDFDSTALEAVAVERGGFLASDGADAYTPNSAVDNTTGTVDMSVARRNADTGVAGSGTLFTVEFRTTERVEGPGTLSELGLTGVLLSDVDENEVSSSSVGGAVTVTDGTPPTAQLAVPDRVAAGEPFVADASASTDNDAIANYTFAVDGDEVAASPNATATLNVSETGNHTVSVTVVDEAGNEDIANETVRVTPGADLRASVAAPETQRIENGVTANVTMRNVGSAAAPNATLRLDAAGTYWNRDHVSTSSSWNVSLDANESITRTVNLTQWVREDLDPYSFASGRISLVAQADSTGTVLEADEGNNRVTDRTVATFTELNVYVRADDRLANQSGPVSVYVRNYGSATVENRTVNVTLGDGNWTTFHTGEIGPDRSVRTDFPYAYNETGDYVVTASVADDSDTDYVDVVEFDLEADVYAPDAVDAGSSFRLFADFDTNVPSDTNVSFEPSENLTVDGNDALERRYEDSWGEWVAWDVTAPHSATGDDRDLNVSVAARDESVNLSTDVTVEVPTTRVTDSSSVALGNNTSSAATTLEVRNEETFEHNLTLSVQAGAEGRSLEGLQYLFTYPYGCVEQTTSPMLAALYTDQYYRDRPSPDDYSRDRTNRSIRGGAERLAGPFGDGPRGAVGQQADGSWTMWGGSGSGDMFYTAYAFRGMSAVRNDPVQGERPEVKELAANATDFNETVFWLREHQRANGAFPSDGYFLDNDESMTGFVAISLSQAGPFNDSASAEADAVRRNATDYLLATEENGSWGDNRSTALALWGLQSAVESGALDESTEREANAAIANATAHLVDVQGADGAWRMDGGYYWDSTGRDSIATSYALLALNATGVQADNATLEDGVSHLVGVYEEGGSWGDTESSAVAIQALQTLGQGLSSVDRTVEVTVEDDDGNVTKTVSVDGTDNAETVSFTDAELGDLRNGSVAKPVAVDAVGGGYGTAVVALENDQLVNRSQYEATSGGGSGGESFTVSTTGSSFGTTDTTESAGDTADSPFAATVSAPETLTTGESTLAVTVNNTADDTLVSPIVEIPVVGSMNVSNASAYTVVNGSREAVPLDRTNSTFTGGESVSVFGREVPANGERTYYVNVSLTSPGDLAVEADVRPLYNESLNARPNDTFEVQSTGTLRVNVANASGGTVSIDEVRTPLGAGGDADVTLPSGTTNVSTSADGALALPNLSVTVPRYGERNVSYTPAPRYPDPTAVAAVGDAAVVDGSVNRVTERTANATTAGERNVSFTVADTDGPAVVAFETPAGYNRTDVSLSGNVSGHEVSRSGNLTVVEMNATGDVGVRVGYDGYVLGDIGGDGDVTADDAAAIADAAATSETGPPAADVNGDGRVTVVDAMFVAQYESGERDGNYEYDEGGA